MRYCSQCGQALNPGAAFCHHCGTALKTLVPEADETPVAIITEETPVAEAPVVAENPPVAAPVADDSKAIAEEKEFLEQTHRLLGWERNAWRIPSKILLIFGIIITAIYTLIGMVTLGTEVGPVGLVFLAYGMIFAYFIVMGAIGLSVADKMPQYMDTMYKDFRAAHKRCGSIGMIVFCYFFGKIALVFFLINFIRIKSNKAMIDRILTRQGFK